MTTRRRYQNQAQAENAARLPITAGRDLCRLADGLVFPLGQVFAQAEGGWPG